MNPRPISRLKCGGDRLTELPDHIRLHILTFLPIKEAIHTSLLSKSWINLWSHLSTLVFRLEPEDYPVEVEEVKAFTCFIDKALIYHNSQHLDRFGVSFDFCAKYHEKQVHSWLRFAVNRNAKHIYSLFEPWEDIKEINKLCNIPTFLLQSHVLVSLNLKSCRLNTCTGEIKCQSLKSLSLDSCGLNDKFVDKLLLGCPVLEKLELVSCQGIIDVNIYHEGLKQLFIKWLGFNGGMIRISAPCVTSLSLVGYNYPKCQLSNLSYLVDAFIDLHCSWRSLPQGLMARNVLARMANVKKLTFGPGFVQALPLRDTTYPPLSISACTNLVLQTYLNVSQLQGLAWLFRSCPQLESFTINMWNKTNSSSSIDYARTSFWESELSDGYFSFLDHLKYVNVIDPASPHPETKHITEFLQFILKHGKVFKILSIKAKRNYKSMSDYHSCLNNHFELAQTLLSYPRLSREAVIHFTVF